jgi:DNA-binding IclR family transcriptional regulator
MSTVAKTLSLLNLLSEQTPQLGLTQFVQLSGYDKATTYRRLTELVNAGFLEQDPIDKNYRLGSGITRLALVREATHPVREIALKQLQQLNVELDETVHVSLLHGTQGLNTVAHVDDKNHGNRVYIDPAAILPLNATASGLAVMAFASQDLQRKLLSQKPINATTETLVDIAAVADKVKQVQSKGYAITHDTYELGVTGIGVPIFNALGEVQGAIACAMPTSRIGDEQEKAKALMQASKELTQQLGGKLPPLANTLWG